MPKEKTRRHYTCKKCASPRRYRNDSTSWKWKTSEPIEARFSTTDELDKHLRAEHRSKMFRCTAVGCLKGQTAPKFQKSEALTQHIKESHNADVGFHCPIETCGFGPSKIDDLAMHAHRHQPFDQRYGWEFSLRLDSAISPFANAATWMYFKCPVWNCRKIISKDQWKVTAHMETHSVIELYLVKDKLRQDGYEIQGISNLNDQSHAAGAILMQIVCEACGALSDSDETFRDHIDASHILASKPGTVEHFKAWRAEIAAWSVDWSRRYNSQVPCWEESDFRGLRKLTRGDDPRKCPACSFELRQDDNGNSHPSLLRACEDATAELLPYRMSILRHYPEFIKNPIFERHAERASTSKEELPRRVFTRRVEWDSCSRGR